MSEFIPKGFSFAGLHCGIKSDAAKEDLSLVVADRACVAAGVYTQNQVVAAPVIHNRERTPANDIRAVITNSGNANACTGQQGLEDCAQMARITAAALGLDERQILVMSTGIIGEHLPMPKIEVGINQASTQLGHDVAAVTSAGAA